MTGEDRRAPGWTKEEVAPDVRYEVAIVGAGMSGLLAAYRLQQAGVDFVVLEKDERGRRDVVGEHLSGVPCRQPEPQLQLLVRPARRLADALLHPGRARRLLPRLRRAARPAGPHPVRHRGRVGDVVGHRSPLDGAHPTADGTGDALVVERRDQRHRAAQPPAPARDPGTGHVRRAGVPLGAVAGRPRPQRQAGRRRSAPAPVPRSSSRSSPSRPPSVRDLPAHTGLVRAHPRLPRPGRGRACAGCTATCRTTANGTASGSSGRWATDSWPPSRATRRGSRRTRRSAR